LIFGLPESVENPTGKVSPSAPGVNSAQPARRAAVDRAREAWIRRLIDLSRRNNLLYYRDLKTERVQGDERDAIILTLGTGKDRAGRLDHRQVRPLNQKGGERRLNFATGRIARLDDIARLAVFFASE